jgi:heparanase 1
MLVRLAGLCVTTALLASAPAVAAGPAALTPATMPRVATVDERFQSFNIEMVEVTGGRFWAPYKSATTPPSSAPKADTPAGMDPSLFRYRKPLDLANPRLRALAAALGPTYIRVSGTWANSTFFQDSEAPAPATPPSGFGGALTRAEWKGVVDFTHAVDAKIVTSFAINAPVRDANGVWTPIEAQKFLAYTHKIGGTIAAAELINEPSFASMGGAPKGYNADTYASDWKVFVPYIRKAEPHMIILGPGSVGEGGLLAGATGMQIIHSEDMLRNEGPAPDAFSYHFYGGVSQRCARSGVGAGTTIDQALSADWLNRTLHDETFYAALRDRFTPGKPMWVTETGETACGGDPWASTFADSFRYLNQLGALARQGIQVVIHNTLAASDYAVIDEDTLTPRPNYWSALLWRRLMGTTVLDAGPSPTPDLHVYAQCLRGTPGGVAILAINADRTVAHSLTVPLKSQRYTLTAAELTSSTVALNGMPLQLGPGDTLPQLIAIPAAAGEISFAPASITFLAAPNAANPACK